MDDSVVFLDQDDELYRDALLSIALKINKSPGVKMCTVMKIKSWMVREFILIPSRTGRGAISPKLIIDYLVAYKRRLVEGVGGLWACANYVWLCAIRLWNTKIWAILVWYNIGQ